MITSTFKCDVCGKETVSDDSADMETGHNLEYYDRGIRERAGHILMKKSLFSPNMTETELERAISENGLMTTNNRSISEDEGKAYLLCPSCFKKQREICAGAAIAFNKILNGFFDGDSRYRAHVNLVEKGFMSADDIRSIESDSRPSVRLGMSAEQVDLINDIVCDRIGSHLSKFHKGQRTSDDT